MSNRLRKVLAVVVLIIIACLWFLTLKGIPGVMSPIANKIQKGLDIEGGVYVVLEAKGTENMSDEERKDLMDRTQAVVTNRVDALGLSNPTVSIEGNNRIRVELPGMTDAEEAAQLIGQTAQLKFVLADGTFILNGDDVKDASTTRANNDAGYAVSLKFSSEGQKKFTEATKVTAAGGVTSTLTTAMGVQVPNNSIVILLDDEIISYPTADEVIQSDSCIIEGNFSEEEASQLAALIKGGSLPAELEEVSSSSQTATIGMNAFKMSVLAGLIGILIVFLIMLIGYRIMGLAANIALAFYIVLIIIAMALMGNVLTLPGIAGIILSIGMAVDANVIIFSRIKEEIVSGKTIRVATKSGYKRALSTIVDSQITTLIATVILYQLGTSSVKGFAWTLMLGIIISLFTAVVLTQLYINVFAESEKFSKPGFFGIKPDGTATFAIKKPIDIIGKRKIFYCISCGIIVLGLIFTIFRGFNYGIDFTGGTMLNIDMGKQVTTEQIKDVAKDFDINTKQMEVVFTGDNHESVIIKTNESLDTDERKAFIAGLQSEFGFGDDAILASEHFGPSVGNELKKNALLAIGLAALGMLIYIRIRFRKWKFGAASLLGVLHDVLIVMAFYVIFGITVNNPFIAAILTVVGYSINDTIVIFDRVRENERYARDVDIKNTLNTSINQTLSRSIMTSVTTLVVMIPLLIMAGSAIREFVLPLMVGVIAGCISSICICSPLYYNMSIRNQKSEYEKRVARTKKYQGAAKKEKLSKKEREEQKALAADSNSVSNDEIKDEAKSVETSTPSEGTKKKSKIITKKIENSKAEDLDGAAELQVILPATGDEAVDAPVEDKQDKGDSSPAMKKRKQGKRVPKSKR